MALHKLPSRDDFVANHVTVIDSYNICFHPFSAEHLPAHASCTNSCYHVFESTCLRKWLTLVNNNANKCPSCRKLLYYMAEDDDDDDEDEGGYNSHDQQSSGNNASRAMNVMIYHPN